MSDRVENVSIRQRSRVSKTEEVFSLRTASQKEYELLVRAHACSKAILGYVNAAVRDCENHQKLVELQRRLDKRSIEHSTHPVIVEYKVRAHAAASWQIMPGVRTVLTGASVWREEGTPTIIYVCARLCWVFLPAD